MFIIGNRVSCVQMRIYLGAVVDGVFLTDLAEELLKRKEVMRIPVMMGITNHEFGWILPQVIKFYVFQIQMTTARLCDSCKTYSEVMCSVIHRALFPLAGREG